MSVYFNKVTIIGVGLIGGSLARVMKLKGLAGSITGAGRNRSTLETAIKMGVIDHMGQDSAHAVRDADLVAPMAKAAVAAGADGLIIEVHSNPEEALCDG